MSSSIVSLCQQQLDTDMLKSLQTNILHFADRHAFEPSVRFELKKLIETEVTICKQRIEQQNIIGEEIVKQSKSLEEQMNELRKEVEELLHEKNVLQSEQKKLELSSSLAGRSKENLMDLLSNRNQELSALRAELNELKNDQMVSRNERQRLTLEQLAFEQKEREFEERERHLIEDKNFYQNAMEKLREQYEKTVLELDEQKRLMFDQSVTEKAKIENFNEQIKRLNNDLNSYKIKNAKKEEQLNASNIKLSELQEHQNQILETYRSETLHQHEILTLNRNKIQLLEENEHRLEEEVEKLKELLVTCNQAEKEMEHALIESKKKTSLLLQKKEDELAQANEEIRLLSAKLEDSFHGKIQSNLQLHYPTSSAVSKLLKQNLPVSLIYSEYEKLQKKYECTQQTIKDLQSQLAHILVECGQSVPVLHEQQELDSKVSIEPFNRLYSTVIRLVNDYEARLEEVNTYKNQANQLTSEKVKYEQTNADLSRQVRILLKTLCEARGQITYESEDKENYANMSKSQACISSQFVTFKSIEELQKNNERLLIAIREMCRLNERLEQENNSKELQVQVENLCNKLDKLEEERRRNQELVAECFNQRGIDVQQSSGKGDTGPIIKMSSRAYLEKKLTELEEQLEEKEQQISSIKKEYSQKMEKAEKQLLQLDGRRFDLQIDNNRLSTELQATNSKVKSLNISLVQFTKDNQILKDKHAKMAERVKICYDELNNTKKELSIIKKDSRKIRSELEVLKSENSKLKSYEQELLNNESELESVVKTKTNEVMDLRRQIDSLKNSNQLERLEIISQQNLKISEQEKKLVQLNMELLRVQSELSEAQKRLEEKEEQIKKINITFKNKLSTVQTTRENLDTELNQVKLEKKSLEDRLLLIQKTSENSSSLRSAQIINEQKLNIQNLEHNLEKINQDLLISNEQNNHLRQKLNEFDGKIQKMDLTSKSEIEAKNALNIKLENVRASLIEKEAILKELHTNSNLQKNQLESRIQCLELEVADVREQILEKERRIEQLDSELQSYKEEIIKNKDIHNVSTSSSSIQNVGMFCTSKLTPTASIRPLSVNRPSTSVAVINPTSDSSDSSHSIPQATITPSHANPLLAYVTPQTSSLVEESLDNQPAQVESSEQPEILATTEVHPFEHRPEMQPFESQLGYIEPETESNQIVILTTQVDQNAPEAEDFIVSLDSDQFEPAAEIAPPVQFLSAETILNAEQILPNTSENVEMVPIAIDNEQAVTSEVLQTQPSTSHEIDTIIQENKEDDYESKNLKIDLEDTDDNSIQKIGILSPEDQMETASALASISSLGQEEISSKRQLSLEEEDENSNHGKRSRRKTEDFKEDSFSYNSNQVNESELPLNLIQEKINESLSKQEQLSDSAHSSSKTDSSQEKSQDESQSSDGSENEDEAVSDEEEMSTYNEEEEEEGEYDENSTQYPLSEAEEDDLDEESNESDNESDHSSDVICLDPDEDSLPPNEPQN